jgi:biotin carboxyl carrier protein
VDAAYRKNGTHNDNTVVTDALTLTDAQKDALAEWGHIQQQIEMVLTRFDSRVSQMTPWDSDWAGGTEGSDLRIAKEYDINPRLLSPAKEVATEVFPLERAVTPFSEYKLRLGIGILLEEGIQPKTAEKVREWVNKGGKLRVGGDVLVGLQRWETLVPKSPEVDQLLKNMDDELQTALNCVTNQITMDDLPADATPEVIFNSLGFQQKGFDFAKAVKTGSDLTPLLMAPLVLHSQPRTLPAGTKFEVFDKPGDLFSKQQVTFTGFGKLPNGDISMGFLVQGNEIKTSLPDPDAAVAAQAADGPRKAVPGDITQMPCLVPGEVLQYNLRPGDSVKAGDPMVVLESMKMEMKISVPDEYDGMIVKAIPCKVRTKETQGAILSPGDLLLEFENPDECAFEPEETA